jgi:hypothetical protein
LRKEVLVKPIKSTAVMFGIVAATTVSASAFAHHRDWHDGGPRARAYPERPYVVVPRTDVTVGFVAGAPAAGYYYEPAPRYYYYEPAPVYYYERAPAYYYYDESAFPRSNSRD